MDAWLKILNEVDLTGANYGDPTRWPEDFLPGPKYGT